MSNSSEVFRPVIRYYTSSDSFHLKTVATFQCIVLAFYKRTWHLYRTQHHTLTVSCDNKLLAVLLMPIIQLELTKNLVLTINI